MKNMIKELWHGNIVPQEDGRNSFKEVKKFIKLMSIVCFATTSIFEYAGKLGMQFAVNPIVKKCKGCFKISKII